MMETIIQAFDASRTECGCRDPFGEPKEARDELLLDVRGLPWEGGVGRTLATMEHLPRGKRLRHVNSMVPWPLLAMLDTRGYRYRLVSRAEGEVHFLVWPLTASPKAA